MVYRVPTIAGLVVASLALTGCAGMWDTLSSRRFRDEPYATTKKFWVPEDPLVVLRASPPRDGDERAKALLRLQEPLAIKLTQKDQDEVMDILSRAATIDPSPYIRLAAIAALTKFQDQRVAGILVVAYQNAHGRPDGVADPVMADPVVQQAGGFAGRTPTSMRESLLPLSTPTGFPPETVSAIRCRAAESLGRTNNPEAVRFLATVATSKAEVSIQGDNREVRLAAIRGLGHCRQPEAVVALAQVLANEKQKDTAVVGRAHDGLVRLTGKHLPADPEKWNEVVQAGVVLAPEPTFIDNAVQTAAAWVKK